MSDKMLQYIHDYLDGEISSEDSQRLEEWLQESRENVRSFVTASHIHRQLRDLTIGDAAHRSLTPLSERPLVRPTESRSTLYIFSYRRFARPGQHQCCLLLPTDFPTGPTANSRESICTTDGFG